MNNKMLFALLVLIISLFSGCSVFYTPGMSELEALCEKDGGITIYQSVRVKGYFDGRTLDCNGCWNEIILDGYDFIEFQNKSPRPYRYFGGDAGYHRIFKAAKSDPRCNAAIWKWDLSKKVGSRDYDKFFENYCIASEPIEGPEAQYGYFKKSREWKVSEHYGSRIAREEYTIKDLITGKVAAKNVMYKLNPFPNSVLAYGKVISCSSVLPRTKFPQPIILPQKAIMAVGEDD